MVFCVVQIDNYGSYYTKYEAFGLMIVPGRILLVLGGFGILGIALFAYKKCMFVFVFYN